MSQCLIGFRLDSPNNVGALREDVLQIVHNMYNGHFSLKFINFTNTNPILIGKTQ